MKGQMVDAVRVQEGEHTFLVLFNEGDEIAAMEQVTRQASWVNDPMTYGVAAEINEMIREGPDEELNEPCDCEECMAAMEANLVGDAKVWSGQTICGACNEFGWVNIPIEGEAERPNVVFPCQSCGLIAATAI